MAGAFPSARKRYVTDDGQKSACGHGFDFLEFNHEISMLQNGAYPYPLKQRILFDKGHLSNYAAGEFAKELLQGGTNAPLCFHTSAGKIISPKLRARPRFRRSASSAPRRAGITACGFRPRLMREG